MSSAAPLKRFEIVRCLGEGGMGVVYEALDRERGTNVALKTLRHMTAESLAQLKREFRALQDLHHPNLVSLGELVSEGDTWFFTMELVQGRDFLDYVRPTPSEHFVLPTNPSEPTLEALPTSTGRQPTASAIQRGSAVHSSPTDPPLFDDARLRSGLRQLADGLGALHGAGLVHRDIKPSNVRVTADGRVVILDFGLVVQMETDLAVTQQPGGTPGYMAPEQVGSVMVGPEADWYGLGVLLFEALTRRLPFEGTALEVITRKQRDLPPAPSASAPGVPSDLDALCLALLNRDSSVRAKGVDVLRVLGRARASASGSVTHTQANLFVGRGNELEALMTAFRDSRHGRPVTVVVAGESGVGKTALVSRFARRLALEVPETVVLAGRCFERESVPYKAFDGVVDALGRFLTRWGPEGASIVPTKPAPLVKVFPVLRRVKVIAEHTRGPQPDIAGPELRVRAFAALRELFTRLTDRYPLLVIIDDAQWSDADSLALLSDLLRPPDAPPLMLVLTARGPGSPRSGGSAPERTFADTLQGDLRRIELGPLPEEDATDLASQLLERTGVIDASRARWAAHQAAGHPLFIDMVMRQSDRLARRDGAALKLEDVLWAVIKDLEATPLAVLETVAVASAPMPQDIVRRAISASSEAFSKALSLLRVAHLVQTSGARGGDRVEPYHDRVRVTVLGHLEETRRAECHRRIAVALETSSSLDTEALVLHWRGAGDEEQVAHYAALAGDNASDALAFDRAADFFKLALNKKGMGANERRALLIKLAKALEAAGRGADAARAYLDAGDGAPPMQRLDLERAAAVELLACGRLDEGITVLRRVLASVGFTAPRSPLEALCWLIAYNLWLRIVGVRFKLRSADEVRREDLARIDAIFAAAMGFAGVDLIMGSCLVARHLIAALRSGDRVRVLRAIAFHIARLASFGGMPTRFERHLDDVVARLVEDEGPGTRAFCDSARGYALYLRGRWRDALTMLDSCVSRAQSHSHAAGSWRSNARLLGCWTLDLLGEYRELSQRYGPYLADADRRADLYASVQLRVGSVAAVWLATDRPEEAGRIAREGIAQWPPSRYLLQHWQLMVGEAEIALYLGNGAEAYDRVQRDSVVLRKSMLLRTQVVRGKTLFLQGRCAIASLVQAPKQRATRLTEARRLARKLKRERMPWMAPLAAIVSAGIASAEDDPSRAVVCLRSAIELAKAADMSGYATAAQHQLGLLLGGEEGTLLVSQARNAMVAQGVREPARFIDMLAPGYWVKGRALPPAPRSSP